MSKPNTNKPHKPILHTPENEQNLIMGHANFSLMHSYAPLSLFAYLTTFHGLGVQLGTDD